MLQKGKGKKRSIRKINRLYEGPIDTIKQALRKTAVLSSYTVTSEGIDRKKKLLQRGESLKSDIKDRRRKMGVRAPT